MILGASEYGQCVGPGVWSLGVVGGASGCGHWVWSVGGGYTVYLIMKYPYSSCVCAFWQPHPYFLSNTFKFCAKLKVWMTIVESGWNVWVWLVGVGGIYGCGCKEVYRFPHITYPYSSISSIPTFCSFLTLGPHAQRGL